jgi:hypothetical protein
MAMRIEWILILSISLIVSLAYEYKVSNNQISYKKANRDLEFYDTIFSKVDTKSLLNKIYTTYGVLHSKVLDVQTIKYQDLQVNKLTANKAIIDKDVITLDGNVSIYLKDGLEFFSQKAIYNKKISKLNIPTQFFANMQKDKINGNSLVYDLNTKIALASKVNAKVELDTQNKE